MNIWEPDKILLFLVFFIPGFVSIKVYELIVASKSRNFSTSIPEAVGYSVLNFAVFFWLIFLITVPDFKINHPILYFLCIILIFFVAPTIWPVCFIWIFKFKVIRKFILNPIKMPWDDVFNRRKAYWVIIHLKDGRKIGGKYGLQSRASSFPNQRQIYLQELWKLDSNNGFQKKISRSGGALFFEDEILIIEFFN
ncbi:DUF6338 family protein [Desulfospira joergensenii]|uniref:DUF6338 family protein n=1 Tax=Desulfospira joergensenii TaxID=53329 RepID=UPI0003B66EE2|nr:DUF6338 family protein [Desulfospira joergensenii]